MIPEKRRASLQDDVLCSLERDKRQKSNNGKAISRSVKKSSLKGHYSTLLGPELLCDLFQDGLRLAIANRPAMLQQHGPRHAKLHRQIHLGPPRSKTHIPILQEMFRLRL